MGQRIDRIKAHLKENKPAYLAGVSCLGVGVLLGVLFKSQPTIINSIAPVIAPVIEPVFEPVFNNDNSSGVNFGGYSHKIVRNNRTGEIWETVKDASETAGVETSRMSRHLNGHIPHVEGETYSIIGVGTTG